MKPVATVALLILWPVLIALLASESSCSTHFVDRSVTLVASR